MKIRSVTYFCKLKSPVDDRAIRAAADFLARAKDAYEAAGYEVQSTRLATVPFPRVAGSAAHVAEFARQLEQQLLQAGIPHASLGPALPEAPEFYGAIPEALAATQNIFFGGVMADRSRGIDVRAVRECARVMVKAAPLDPNGFANLRFAALANVGAGSPFFPAAYHGGEDPGFAIATEAADLAINAFSGASSINDGRKALVDQIEKHGKLLEAVSVDLRNGGAENGQSPRFIGIDFSLAPFPDAAISLGTAFEKLGVPSTGLHGSLAAAALITEAIERANFHRTGFSGLMMPVLEDATLAQRAAQGTLSLKDVLLYSAVCGTGLDTIPLPGDTTAEQIVPVLLDLCALALRLDKPLTARLMPVPGKRAGEQTNFDFGFFANSKVMALESQALKGPLGEDQVFELRGRQPR